MLQQIFFDLSIDEIAIILHSFLHKAESEFSTINVHIDKYHKYEKSGDRYTLIIIASTYNISKYELLSIYKRICNANGIDGD